MYEVAFFYTVVKNFETFWVRMRAKDTVVVGKMSAEEYATSDREDGAKEDDGSMPDRDGTKEDDGSMPGEKDDGSMPDRDGTKEDDGSMPGEKDDHYGKGEARMMPFQCPEDAPYCAEEFMDCKPENCEACEGRNIKWQVKGAAPLCNLSLWEPRFGGFTWIWEA